MKLRSYRESDVERIDEIWKEYHQDFSVPDRSASLIDATIEGEDGRVIAYGQVKLFTEAQMVLDLGARPREKVRALELLMQEAFRGVRGAGLKELYMFVKNPDFALLVEKHFGFSRVDDPGELLLWKG